MVSYCKSFNTIYEAGDFVTSEYQKYPPEGYNTNLVITLSSFNSSWLVIGTRYKTCD